MLLYAVTIFLSAFLLFQVQPLIAKIILPWFGGSAAVWSAALMFFQISLLAGYAYAHVVARYLKPRMQAIVHGALLLGSLALLPILPSPDWKPTAVGDPTIRIVLLLAATIGLPYFLLSSTSPLLQVWYVRRTGSQVPYKLFALSNFGSMLALLSFPFVVEPQLASTTQAYTWSGLYIGFAALCVYAGWVSRIVPATLESTAAAGAGGSIGTTTATAPIETPGAEADLSKPPTLGDKTLWVSLAACASVLLVSITNHMSQNVAPIPLLWVVPLALYLLSFILAFESDKIYQRWLFVPWVAPALGWMAYSIYAEDGNYHIKFMIPIFSAGLFLCCMLCHGELALRKPAPQYLTSFYLMVSLGGALGGVFVAMIAPNVFKTFLELPIALVATGILAVIVLWDVHVDDFKIGKFTISPLWFMRFGLAIGVGLLGGYLARMEFADRAGYHLMVRNFYGALRVRDDDVGTEWALRSLLHGTINHGSQRLTPENEFNIASYYSPGSGIGRTMAIKQDAGPVRYGVIGLGAGVMSGYARKEDYVRIYEINPLVPKIAQSEFTYYPHSQADKAILMGDARLTLEKQEPQNYDVLVVDAFSSDAIPVHLLTDEVMELYFKHLKPDGVLAVHISNRYLDLAPVCARGAEYVHKTAMVVYDESQDSFANSTTWVLITADPTFFDNAAFVGDGVSLYPATAEPNFRGWTDDYSSILPILSLN